MATDSSTKLATTARSAKALLAFVAKWALAGLAFAGALLWLRPELLTPNRTADSQDAPLAAKADPPLLPTAADRESSPVAVAAPPTTGFADAVERSAPSVVNIYTRRVVTERVRPQALDRLFGNTSPAIRRRVEGSLGSGVIVDARGHVVTNFHVIANAQGEIAQEISLQLADGRVAPVKLVGVDPDSDLAVLKVDLPRLQAMPMGRSDKLRVGDVALAIGNPYGLSQTVTHGIISATGRDHLGLRQFESFIQTDAAINVGNSGGALINGQGELIGINTATQGAGSEGIGFAIPVNMVRGVVEQIVKHGRVRRGWLGVNSQTLTPRRLAELGMTGSGIELMEVYEGSPAAKAGLRPGDIITTLNGAAVYDDVDAVKRVAGLKPGSSLRVQGRRAQEPLDVRVTLDERPPE